MASDSLSTTNITATDLGDIQINTFSGNVLDNDEYIICDDGRYLYYTNYTDDKYSLVDNEKNITVEKSHTEITQENNSEYCPFKIKRYWDGIDLMNMFLQIHYVNKQGNDNYATPVNVRYNSESIIFAWLIDRGVTSIDGTIQFEIVGWGANEMGDNYSWVSRPNGKINIIKSLVSTGVIQPTDEWYTAFVNQIVENAVEAKKQANTAIDAAERAQTHLNDAKTIEKNIATDAAKYTKDCISEIKAVAAEQTLEAQSISENVLAYVEAEKASFVGYSKRDSDIKYANALIGTASGTGRVTVSDAWNAPVRNMVVRGRTSNQVTTSGAQLLDVNNSVVYSATLAKSDNNIYVSGTAGFARVEFNISLSLVGKTIILSRTGFSNTNAPSSRVDGYYVIDNARTYFEINTPITIPVEATTIRCRVVVNNASTEMSSAGTVTVSGLMINLGNTALPWEPYTGGVASPSPEYPQQTVSVENPVVVEKGTNWFDISSYKFYENPSVGSINITGAAMILTSNGYSRDIYVGSVNAYDVKDRYYDVLPNAKYSINWDEVTYSTPGNLAYSSPRIYVGFFNKKKTYISYIYPDIINSDHSFTSPVDAAYMVVRVGFVQTTATANETMTISNVRINLGSVVLPWLPYRESAVSLAGYTLRGIGDVRDCLECRDGVWGIER